MTAIEGLRVKMAAEWDVADQREQHLPVKRGRPWPPRGP